MQVGARTAMWANDMLPLTLTANTAGSTVTFNYASGSDVLYRINNGVWTECPSGTAANLNNVGDYVQYIGNGVKTNADNHFVMTGSISASGSVTSLLNNGNMSYIASEYCCLNMFNGCSALTTAPTLDALTLEQYCYHGMFKDCTGLIAAPEIPGDYGFPLSRAIPGLFREMFSGCTNLEIPPSKIFPSLTRANYASYSCYQMFYGCTNLKTPPDMSNFLQGFSRCCYSMFENSGLENLPSFYSYFSFIFDELHMGRMFTNCSGLTGKPILHVKSYGSGEKCLRYMFSGCPNVTEVEMLAACPFDESAYGPLASHTITITYV